MSKAYIGSRPDYTGAKENQGKPTVEPQWAKQQTKKLRPLPTKIKSFTCVTYENFVTYYLFILTGPDSSSGRASASGAGGRRFETRPRHTKGVKMVPVATLLGAQHYKASTGFSHSLLTQLTLHKKKKQKKKKKKAEAIRMTVVPISILIRTTVVPIRILIRTTGM